MPIRHDEVMIVNERIRQIGLSFRVSKDGQRRAVFQCECGNRTVIWLHSGTTKTRSCGCLAAELSRERERTHGHTVTEVDGVKKKTNAYRVWSSMHERCSNPNNGRYHVYGARGISVCERWKSFENFLEDMGEPPSGMSIDRVNNDQDYCPENCKWSDRFEQARNKQNNRMVEHDGESRCIAEWAEIYGISYDRLQARIYAGWTLERAVTQPFRKSKRVSKE